MRNVILTCVMMVSGIIATPGQQKSAKEEKFDLDEVVIEGQVILENTCFACHNPNTASHDEILAPPLVGIKQRYLRSFPSKDEFVTNMKSFVYDPSSEKALMHGPVRRFGVMPKTALTEEEVAAVVDYIFENELPAPKWFAEHERKMHGGNR